MLIFQALTFRFLMRIPMELTEESRELLMRHFNVILNRPFTMSWRVRPVKRWLVSPSMRLN